MTYSNIFFCPTNSPKPKDIQFSVIHNLNKHEEKLQIFPFENQEPVNVWPFCLKNCWSTDNRLID